jgi:hypothetical protein
MLSLGTLIRKEMQVDWITYEEAYKAQDGSQTQICGFMILKNNTVIYANPPHCMVTGET